MGAGLGHAARQLDDIDIVMNYFDGLSCYERLSDALKKAFAQDQSSGIESTYFRATAYMKGTIHLTFKDPDIFRRFNLAASQGKGWLPNGYGEKPYHEMHPEEQRVVDSFEGQKSYGKNLGQKVFAQSVGNLPLLKTA